jgi:hypothetical protein
MESFWNGFEKQAAPGFVHGGYAMKMLRESKALKPAASVAAGAASVATKAAIKTISPISQSTINATRLGRNKLNIMDIK